MGYLLNTFTSTGAKFFAHQEAMRKLSNGQGQPITTHVMLTDICNHSCAFCSVHHREGNTLSFKDICAYLDLLVPLGLKSVILSGGGNPILYRDGRKTFGNVVEECCARGLEVGLITNGMSLCDYTEGSTPVDGSYCRPRRSWKTVSPRVLDNLTWVRISMAGLDHEERRVFVPDIDPARTALGFSYVAHDIYEAPEDAAHGKVSTEADVLKLGALEGRNVHCFEERISELWDAFVYYCDTYKPRYLRLLPNCLEPQLIEYRCKQLDRIARGVNAEVVADVAFVQYKPPAAPKACYLGYVHPVLNCDGYVYPCDAVVLSVAEVAYRQGGSNHKFDVPWRMCHWSEIASIYQAPVRSLIDPARWCQGCVFTKQNTILQAVVDGTADLSQAVSPQEHGNFV